MCYIDLIQRQYPYELMGMNKKDLYEFFRNRLLEHYMPGQNGQSISKDQVVEAAGKVLSEMNEVHNHKKDRMNADFEIHLYAEWLVKNRMRLWNYDVKELARVLGNGVYEWCKNNENYIGLEMSQSFLIEFEKTAWSYK